jgi:exonuclease SbcC
MELHSDQKPLEAIISTLSASLLEQQEHLNHLHQEFSALKQERTALFGAKNTDEEERQIEGTLQKMDAAKRLIHDEMTQMTRLVAVAQTKTQALKEQITLREPELCALEAEFLVKLQHLEFKEEAHFLSLYLPIEQRNRLTEQARVLDIKKTSLSTKINDRKERLIIECDKKCTDSGLNELKPLLERANQDLNQTRARVTTLSIQLKNHYEHKEQSAAKQELIKQQKIECQRMDKLHQLIGSSDGKKFRNFAQGLTFELMVNHANKQLAKMTDRYLLMRDEAQPLELNVVDNYQAGELRTTKNLSGGESFIVSLSLALGLSKMASQKVRVDSLFLDEGFGTLDDDALETALETLGELQQDGKIIGIISHVHALKERISTQINVHPVSGGKSAITGPGCRATSSLL